ncbi:MAG: DUF6712 family protein [Sediminibacterium sp.]
MFFKNIQEFKAANPRIAANTSLEVLTPFITQVETEVLIPVLSQTQYDDLNTKYLNTNMSADEKTLVDKIQKALAPLVMSAAAPEMNLTISDLGMQMHSSENAKQPFQWMIRDYQRSRERVGYSALEQMLIYLEQKKLVFTLWAASASFTEYKECYINTALDFSNLVNIRNHRFTFLALKPFMKDVEEEHIVPMIGATYNAALKAIINAGSAPSAANAKVILLIQKAVAHLTIAEAIPLLGIEISSLGFIVTSVVSSTDNDTEKKAAPNEFLSNTIEFQKQKGKSALKLLRDLLYSSATDYPTFTADTSVYITPPTDGTDSVQFPNKATNTFYFGG